MHKIIILLFNYTSLKDWTLQIEKPTSEDNGLYECQVSSTPKKSLFVQLNVVGKFKMNLAIELI